MLWSNLSLNPTPTPPWPSTHLLLLAVKVFLSPLPWKSLNLVEREMIPSSYSSVSFSLHVDQFWVSMVIVIYCIKKLLWWGLKAAAIFEHKNKYLGDSLIICLFSWIMTMCYIPWSLWTTQPRIIGPINLTRNEFWLVVWG